MQAGTVTGADQHTDLDVVNPNDFPRQKWLSQQASIASRVVIQPDEALDAISIQSTEKFSLIATHSLNPSAPRALYGGVDVSFAPHGSSGASVAIYVILDDTLSIAYQDHEYYHVNVPYVPTFQALREIEPLERLVKKQLQTHPDLT